MGRSRRGLTAATRAAEFAASAVGCLKGWGVSLIQPFAMFRVAMVAMDNKRRGDAAKVPGLC